MDVAVKLEENGEQFYRSAAGRSKNAGIRELLNWLADEEARHAKAFQRMKDLLPFPEDGDVAEKLSGEILKGAVDKRLFSLEETDLAALNDMAEVMEHAVELEQDTIIFYEFIAAFIEEASVLDDLMKIVKEEERHVVLLTGKAPDAERR